MQQHTEGKKTQILGPLSQVRPLFPPAGKSTYRLIEAHVQELLVPLLHLRPGAVPQLSLGTLQATQEFLRRVLSHSHVSLGWSRF